MIYVLISFAILSIGGRNRQELLAAIERTALIYGSSLGVSRPGLEPGTL